METTHSFWEEDAEVLWEVTEVLWEEDAEVLWEEVAEVLWEGVAEVLWEVTEVLREEDAEVLWEDAEVLREEVAEVTDVLSLEVTCASMTGWLVSSSTESVPSSSITVILETKWLTSGTVLSLFSELMDGLLTWCDTMDDCLLWELVTVFLLTNRTISS